MLETYISYLRKKLDAPRRRRSSTPCAASATRCARRGADASCRCAPGSSRAARARRGRAARARRRHLRDPARLPARPASTTRRGPPSRALGVALERRRRALGPADRRPPGGPPRDAAGGRRGRDPRQADLPPGTYAERRDAAAASWSARHGRRSPYGQTRRSPRPRSPRDLRAGRSCATVDGDGAGGPALPRPGARPRATAGTLIVAALPLTGVDERARPAAARRGAGHRRACSLLLGGARLAARPARACGRWSGWPRPRTRSPAATSPRRVEVDDPRTEVGRLGLALNAMLGRLERRLRRARGQRGAAAAVPLRRLARAAHAAGLDPGLRRALPDGRARSEPEDTEQAPCGGSRTRRRAWACSSRTCSCSPGSTRCASARPEPVDLAALAEDAAADARAIDPARAITADGAGGRRRRRRPRPAAPGAGQPAAQRARAHAGRDADRGRGAPRRRRAPSSRSATTGPGLPPGDADALFDRFWRAEGGPRARPRRRRARPGDRRRDRRRPRRGGLGGVTARAAARRSSSAAARRGPTGERGERRAPGGQRHGGRRDPVADLERDPDVVHRPLRERLGEALGARGAPPADPAVAAVARGDLRVEPLLEAPGDESEVDDVAELVEDQAVDPPRPEGGADPAEVEREVVPAGARAGDARTPGPGSPTRIVTRPATASMRRRASGRAWSTAARTACWSPGATPAKVKVRAREVVEGAA